MKTTTKPETITTTKLDTVTGGCAACGAPAHNSSAQQKTRDWAGGQSSGNGQTR